jgi:hypothetical protein
LEVDGVGFDWGERGRVGFGSSSAVEPVFGVEAVSDGECGVDGVSSSGHEVGGFACEFCELCVCLGVVGFDDLALFGVDVAA